MHASAQPAQRDRRIDFINQLSAPFTADSARGDLFTESRCTFSRDDCARGGWLLAHTAMPPRMLRMNEGAQQ
jgi:hypothetical protein